MEDLSKVAMLAVVVVLVYIMGLMQGINYSRRIIKVDVVDVDEQGVTLSIDVAGQTDLHRAEF